MLNMAFDMVILFGWCEGNAFGLTSFAWGEASAVGGNLNPNN